MQYNRFCLSLSKSLLSGAGKPRGQTEKGCRILLFKADRVAEIRNFRNPDFYFLRLA